MKIYKGKKVYHTKFKSDEGSKSIKDKTRRVFEYEGYCEEKTGRCHGTGKMTQVVIDNKTGKNIKICSVKVSTSSVNFYSTCMTP